MKYDFCLSSQKIKQKKISNILKKICTITNLFLGNCDSLNFYITLTEKMHVTESITLDIDYINRID